MNTIDQTSNYLPSAAQLAAAPHRMLFLIGALNVLAAMTWWALWLIDQRWQLIGLPTAPAYAGWMHAFIMQYQVLPPFMFGFLLTVFPRWMGQPELGKWNYLPVGIGLLGGQLLVLASLAGLPALLHAGVVLTLISWLFGWSLLCRLIWRHGGLNWHANSCAVALGMGLLGVVLFAVYLHTGNARLLFASIKFGSFALLLPIFVTVAHRMFPFFAGNVVANYTPWRPLSWLLAFWALTCVHLGLELLHGYSWLWLADLPLLALTLLWLWKTWPRGAAPALLRVLFIGSLWLPLAFALFAAQSLWFAVYGEFVLGRAPAHALYVGFFGSLLVAMVTRVTHGHSGRPLQLHPVATFAFVLIQAVALTRIAAELLPDGPAWQALSALGWLIAFLPWVARSSWIYLTPRTDGKPG